MLSVTTQKVWELLDFARKGHALPAEAAAQIQASQLPPVVPAKNYDFEALVTSMRGSQHGPGNDALDALTDLGPSLPGILLVFVQRTCLEAVSQTV